MSDLTLTSHEKEEVKKEEVTFLNMFYNMLGTNNTNITMKSLFIKILLSMKQDISNCKTSCNLCKQIIIIINDYIEKYKNVAKLSNHLSIIFRKICNNTIIKTKLVFSEDEYKLIDFTFLLFSKAGKIIDLEIMCEYFTRKSVNAFNGLSFLIIARYNNYDEILKMINTGADVTVQEHLAMIFAFNNCNFKIIKLLETHCSSYKYYFENELGIEATNELINECCKQFIIDKNDNMKIIELFEDFIKYKKEDKITETWEMCNFLEDFRNTIMSEKN